MCGRLHHLELVLTHAPLNFILLSFWNNNPLENNSLNDDPLNENPLGPIQPQEGQEGVCSPLEEVHSSYRGDDWSPTSLVFHQNLESFAERVGLIVALQSNGKLSQEQAYDQIRKIWKKLRDSKKELLT